MARADQFTMEDVEYARHGGVGLEARLFRPAGDRPAPAVIDVHGGAWNSGDLADNQARNEALARAGFFVAAIDFRHGDDGYPTSLADINYAIRWVKAGADRFGVDPRAVGLTGQSSGGHLAMLAAMRPRDPRYDAIPLPPGSPSVDAQVRCVAMAWPVINPLSRYRHAQRREQAADAPAWASGMKEKHDRYWGSEAAMAEGNPMLALERGERVLTPPALWVQGRPDETHDYRDLDSGASDNEPERFVRAYRAAGGTIELVVVEQVTRSPASVAPIAAFFREQMLVAAPA